MQLLTRQSQSVAVTPYSPAIPLVQRESRDDPSRLNPWQTRHRVTAEVLAEAEPCDVSSRFGRRLRALRHASGLTQMQVSVRFGIDRTFISDVERGRKGVGLPTLEVFALGFGVSLSDLLRDL